MNSTTQLDNTKKVMDIIETTKIRHMTVKIIDISETTEIRNLAVKSNLKKIKSAIKHINYLNNSAIQKYTELSFYEKNIRSISFCFGLITFLRTAVNILLKRGLTMSKILLV